MKYRKLRIAWSVAWGVVAVLLCVLWVRSYYRIDFHQAWGHNFHMAFGWVSIDATSFTISEREVPEGEIKFMVPNSAAVTLPFWIPTVVSFAFAAATSLFWLPRRFSLRTLLIATTLVAVALGFVVWANR